MNLTVFKKYFKAHPLIHTIALSATVHLIAFYFFPTWDSPSKLDKDNLIKIKYVLEKKIPSEEKVSPESKKIVELKKVAPPPTHTMVSPNRIPKSAIIKSTEVFPLSHSAKRNPVPIRNSEKLLQPVNTILKQTPVNHPVAEYKRTTPLEISQAILPSPRMIREAHPNQNTPVPLTQLAMQSKDTNDSLIKHFQNKSFQPVPRLIKSSASTKAASLNSTVQAKSFTEVKYESSQKFTSLASAQLNIENSFLLKTTAIQKPLPVTLVGMPTTHQPVAGINSVSIAGIPNPSTALKVMKPQVLNKPWQAVGTQARASKSLDSESVAHYQPSIPIAASNFSSPLQSTRLLKEAFIPPGFSEEKLNQDEEVSTRPIEKLARLSDGISDLSSALLNQIKNGFSAKIRNRIAQVKYYPRIARSRGFEGQPVVAFTLGNGGELLELSIVNPSPFKLLDEAALDAVKSASPYPPIPELLKINSMKFNLPISFMLEER